MIVQERAVIAVSKQQPLLKVTCEYEVDKLSISDKAKFPYTEKVNTISYNVKGIPVRTTSVPSFNQTRLSQGWALKQRK